jgi:RNA polymerase sigma factor (sigma-70 family)
VVPVISESRDSGAVVEHLFRHEAGRILSTLTRIFGLDRIDLAEDVVQEALLKALQQWPFSGVPENPSAWIMQVAKNHALDILRREQTLASRRDAIIAAAPSSVENPGELFLDHEIKDDELRMMFACCHPSIPVESQIALTLKTLGGFSAAEIARGFLSNEQTIHKRLVRAKQKLRELRAEFKIPSGEDLLPRLNTVLDVLYLLFNEGYNASHGDTLIRKDLCNEAIRLVRLLCAHTVGDKPATHALHALMLLHTARFPARTDEHGDLLLLKDQDRTLWDKRMIDEGLKELELSGEGNEVSEYHLQAGIAACHCLARSYEETDWPRILMLYDMLVQVNSSPVVALNRAIALARVQGPETGIKAVEEIKAHGRLDNYHLLHAVLGEFHMEMGNYKEAAENYRRALELTHTRSEKAFLMRKLETIQMSMN